MSDAFLLDLYACCADAGRWTPVLDRLCGEVGTLSAVVQCIELDGARAVPYWAAYDSRIDMAAYRSEVSDASNPRFDSWRLRRVASRPGRIATDHELFLPGRRPSAIGCTRNCAVPDWGDSWERWRRWGQPLCCPGAA
ncbi:hypothetical protein WJ971_14910 [Achromobacter xylosoxidans]